jgi:hypothetical protein
MNKLDQASLVTLNSVIVYALQAHNQRRRTRSSSTAKTSMLEIYPFHFFLMIYLPEVPRLQSAKQRHVAKIRSALNGVFPVRSTGASHSVGLHDE